MSPEGHLHWYVGLSRGESDRTHLADEAQSLEPPGPQGSVGHWKAARQSSPLPKAPVAFWQQKRVDGEPGQDDSEAELSDRLHASLF
mmetsp:Transcript_17056/g.36999  ORF Transcript_17056/g.36999 Transcript_17056/m.36999 type:complete len:87 (+) Transcript_17056:2200-2460(+)